jgi:hypothetical protein
MQGVILIAEFILTKLCNAKRNARFVIRQLAAVRVRSASIAAKVHPDAKIQSFVGVLLGKFISLFLSPNLRNVRVPPVLHPPPWCFRG